MYKIEKELEKLGFKLFQRYASGTLDYARCDEDGFYGDHVSLMPPHDPPDWMIDVRQPFCVLMDGHETLPDDFAKNAAAEFEAHINRCIELNKKLQSIIEPWSKVE